MRSKIVVCGATGHQGQAVVRHLLASEIRQGKNIVDASVAAAVTHLVFSTALHPESGFSRYRDQRRR